MRHASRYTDFHPAIGIGARKSDAYPLGTTCTVRVSGYVEDPAAVVLGYDGQHFELAVRLNGDMWQPMRKQPKFLGPPTGRVS